MRLPLGEVPRLLASDPQGQPGAAGAGSQGREPRSLIEGITLTDSYRKIEGQVQTPDISNVKYCNEVYSNYHNIVYSLKISSE